MRREGTQEQPCVPARPPRLLPQVARDARFGSDERNWKRYARSAARERRCGGAQLARLEACIAFEALLERAPDLALAVPPERIEWGRNTILRGPRRVPLRF